MTTSPAAPGPSIDWDAMPLDVVEQTARQFVDAGWPVPVERVRQLLAIIDGLRTQLAAAADPPRWVCDTDPLQLAHIITAGWKPCPRCRVVTGPAVAGLEASRG